MIFGFQSASPILNFFSLFRFNFYICEEALSWKLINRWEARYWKLKANQKPEAGSRKWQLIHFAFTALVNGSFSRVAKGQLLLPAHWSVNFLGIAVHMFWGIKADQNKNSKTIGKKSSSKWILFIPQGITAPIAV